MELLVALSFSLLVMYLCSDLRVAIAVGLFVVCLVMCLFDMLFPFS